LRSRSLNVGWLATVVVVVVAGAVVVVVGATVVVGPTVVVVAPPVVVVRAGGLAPDAGGVETVTAVTSATAPNTVNSAA
jgi:hypothetical protein